MPSCAFLLKYEKGCSHNIFLHFSLKQLSLCLSVSLGRKLVPSLSCHLQSEKLSSI